MATVRERKNKDGSTTYQVLWVIGGGRIRPGAKKGEVGSQAAESFRDDLKLRDAFRAAVEAQGHQWPTGWVKGEGWVDAKNPDRPMITLDQVVENWAEFERKHKVQLRDKKGRSLGKDLGMYRNHIQATFGHLPPHAIDRKQIRDWVTDMRAAGAAVSSVRNRHSVLHQLLDHAMLEMKLGDSNPAAKLGETFLGKKEKKNDFMFLTHGEFGLLLDCLKSDVKLMMRVAVETGLRPQELLAITTENLDWQPDDQILNVSIEKAWYAADKEEDWHLPVRAELRESERWRISTTKDRETRQVQLAGPTAADLWYSVQGQDAGSYVFTTRSGMPWRYDDFLGDRWHPAMAVARKAGITKRWTPYMLRHTYAVWMIAEIKNGIVDIYEISRRMGHASINMTMDTYGGRLDLNNPEAARAMARQMVYAETAISPALPSQQEIDATPIRPGRRGERRIRVA